MGLPGVDNPTRFLVNPLATKFRTSWTQMEGDAGSIIREARVIDINMVNWTVDCATVFDQKRYLNIQVSSPYLHSNRGEGIYIMPDVGAKCHVCIPSDGLPPYVLDFIMPSETIPDASTDDAPAGTQGDKGKLTDILSDSTFAGGRTRAKPGDIVLRGRDGNFVVLHRGGVLQIGATDLAQRIFIPLQNLVTDISQNYNHFNTAGSVNWGIRPGSPEDNPETEWRQTYRIYANDQYADVRMAVGKVHTPVPEPAGDAGSTSDLEQLEIGTGDKQIVVEFVVAPQGFDTTLGTNNEPRDKTVIRMFFDEEGGAFLRAESSIHIRSKKRLRITADEGIEIISKKGITLLASEPGRITCGSSLDIGTDGGVVTVNGGTKPVATVGSQVAVNIVAPVPVTGPGLPPGTAIATGATMIGVVTTGNPTVKA